MSWSIPLDRLAAKVGKDMETVVRKSTFDVWRAVVVRSPVDTGRFKGNWNASFGSPDTSTTFSTDAGRGALEAARALTLPVGGVTYFSNGLPYASKLEYGYSQQAPAGMVRVTAQEFSDYVSRAVGGVR